MILPARKVGSWGTMYAVEKLSGYITRGVYSVSGPFHPFGGAVDIIVVQQKDDSFKSSPWYVRFGKFQGVLKAREKVVKICVNDVEAGFSMYLDSKGEAFFLRDADDVEREIIPFPPTSGDDTCAMAKNGLKKTQSLGSESNWKEPVTQLEDGNVKIARTNSRGSMIFGRMFGEKSTKEDSTSDNSEKSMKEDSVSGGSEKSMKEDSVSGGSEKSMKEDSASGTVKRVNSLESAEIVADLLDVKCKGGDKSKEKHSESSETKLSAVNPEQISLSPRLPDGFNQNDVLKSHDKSNLRTDCSEEARNHYSPDVIVDGDVVERYTSGVDYFDNSSKLTSEQVCIYANSIGQVPNLNIINNIDDLERKGDVCMNLMVAEKHFQELSSHDNLAVTSEVSYELLTVERTEFNSASSVNTAQPVDGIHCKRSVECRENDLKSFSPMGSSFTAFDIPSNEVAESGQETTSSKASGGQSEMTSELGSPSGLGGLARQANANSCNMDTLEISKLYDSSVSRTLQGGYLSRSFDGSAANSFNHKLHPDKIQSDNLMEESSMERGENIKEMDALRADYQVGEQETKKLNSFYGRAFINSPYPIGSAVSQNNDIVLASFNSTCEGPGGMSHVKSMDLKPFAIGIDVNQEADDVCRHESVDINQEACGVSRLEETVESRVSTSESLDDIQFSFIEDESFGAYERGCELQKIDTVLETKVQILKAEHDMEEYETKILDDEQFQEDISDALMSYSSPINISACKKNSDGNEVIARSLPIFLAPISQFEEPYLHHLSSSFDAKSCIYETNMLREQDTDLLKQEIDMEINQELVKLAFDSTDTHIAAESSRENFLTSSPTIELSLSKHLLVKGMGADAACQAFDSEKVNLENFCALGPSLVKNNRLVVRIDANYYPWDAAAPIILGMVSFGQEYIFEPQGRIPVEGDEESAKLGPSRTNSPPEGSWRLWPFGLRRARTIDTVQTPTENATKKDETGNSNRESSLQRVNSRRKIKFLTPATEELASLNLKEGCNVVTFTFSTPMLGLQQVDARIYLWKWNTRIVISDVDGTITKSDVLGQFMPLVGMDWSQTGVTHLFSAIKENGYQLLFLSARAISQAHITRQFLVNLKQDGKVLPDGPVVISPDGLFPSLYREVIRRAPHEFKISCLEIIKELFPPDCNPFYAGFGNRDTDELSYLKVGIPLGKIFIINPRGEVAINRHIDTKSYNKLHELVNAIFPPWTSDEQEDYNSWKYWKMPLPDIKN